MYQAMYVDIIEGMIVERTYSCLYMYICLAYLLNISRKYNVRGRLLYGNFFLIRFQGTPRTVSRSMMVDAKNILSM